MSKKRVLWFTNTQMPAVREYLGLAIGLRGGWMSTLINALEKSNLETQSPFTNPRKRSAIISG